MNPRLAPLAHPGASPAIKLSIFTGASSPAGPVTDFRLSSGAISSGLTSVPLPACAFHVPSAAPWDALAWPRPSASHLRASPGLPASLRRLHLPVSTRLSGLPTAPCRCTFRPASPQVPGARRLPASLGWRVTHKSLPPSTLLPSQLPGLLPAFAGPPPLHLPGNSASGFRFPLCLSAHSSHVLRTVALCRIFRLRR